jgi:hypothetical protein
VNRLPPKVVDFSALAGDLIIVFQEIWALLYLEGELLVSEVYFNWLIICDKNYTNQAIT